MVKQGEFLHSHVKIILELNVVVFSEVSSARMSKRGRGGAAGAKFRISLACPVGAVMNCADNTGAKNL